MLRPLFLSSLLVVVSLAGCFSDDGNGSSPSSSAAGPAPDPENSYRVVVRNFTEEGARGEPINVTWEVLPAVDQGNASNESITISHTAIHWGNQSVPDPYTGEEPRSTPTLTTTTEAAPQTTSTTNATNSTGPGSSQGPGEYPNETQPRSGVAPSMFNESFMVNASGLIYIRAHAIIGNKSFWSDEYRINVTGNASLPLGKQHIVTIGGTPGGPLSQFTPKAISIKAGDSIVWKNQDGAPLENQHSAQSTAGTPSFDTGGIATGDSSKPVYFNATGSWTYRCGLHPNTMTGNTITVTT